MFLFALGTGKAQLLFLLTWMKRPYHERAAAAGADEDLILLLMNGPLLLPRQM